MYLDDRGRTGSDFTKAISQGLTGAGSFDAAQIHLHCMRLQAASLALHRCTVGSGGSNLPCGSLLHDSVVRILLLLSSGTPCVFFHRLWIYVGYG